MILLLKSFLLLENFVITKQAFKTFKLFLLHITSRLFYSSHDIIQIVNFLRINLKNWNTFLYAGLLRQPKWGHLKDLHRAIKLCEPALVSGDPAVIPLGNYQEVKYASFDDKYSYNSKGQITNGLSFMICIQAHVFKSKSGACAAFLANYNQRSFSKVAFGNMHYNLPPWSISILPDCKNTVYNTARVRISSLENLNFCSYDLYVSGFA